MTTLKDPQAQLEAMQKQLNALAEKEQPKEWPPVGEILYSVGFYGEITRAIVRSEVDAKLALDAGYCFRTKKEAKQKALWDKIDATARRMPGFGIGGVGYSVYFSMQRGRYTISTMTWWYETQAQAIYAQAAIDPLIEEYRKLENK